MLSIVMLHVASKPFKPSAIMLNVIMLSVVAPSRHNKTQELTTHAQLVMTVAKTSILIKKSILTQGSRLNLQFRGPPTYPTKSLFKSSTVI
jgi:hypothetical protein